MNPAPIDPRRDPVLVTLIEAVLNGQADEIQFSELDRRLQSDATARDIYATYVNLHCELQGRFAVAGNIVSMEAELEKELASSNPLPGPRHENGFERPRPFGSSMKRSAALAALAASVLIGLFFLHRLESRDSSAQARLAHVRDQDGAVTIIGRTDRAARIGDVLKPGERLRTDETAGRAVLEYADGTRVEVHFDSVVQVPTDGEVRLRLMSGSIDVAAATQPAGQPLIIATEHARSVVLGTRFRLYRNEAATRLELQEGKVRIERQQEGRVVEAVDVEPGNTAIASAVAVPLEIIPLAEGRAQLRATLPLPGDDLALSPAGDRLAVSDQSKGLKLCRTDDFTVQSGYKRDPAFSFGLTLTPDGQTVARLALDHVLLWRPGESEVRKLPFSSREARSRALSPDGRLVAVSSPEGIEVSAIDFATGALKRIAVLPAKAKAWSLAFSSTGQRLAAGFWNGTVQVYDLDAERITRPLPDDGQTGKPAFKLAHEFRLASTPTPMAISPDGILVAAFSRVDGIVLINTATGERHELGPYAGAKIGNLKFTPDGRWLMAGSDDHTARLWSVADARSRLVIDAGHIPKGIAFVPEKRLLFTVGNSLKVWELQSQLLLSDAR